MVDHRDKPASGKPNTEDCVNGSHDEPSAPAQDDFWSFLRDGTRIHEKDDDVESVDARTESSGTVITVSDAGTEDCQSWRYEMGHVKRHGNQIMVPLLLDTGSKYSLICRSRAEQLGQVNKCPELTAVLGLSTSSTPIEGKISLVIDVCDQKYRILFFVIADQYVHKAFRASLSAKVLERSKLVVRGPGKGRSAGKSSAAKAKI